MKATYTMTKVVFFGTEDFSAISLRALIDANFPVAAVVTKPDSKRGRGQQLVEPTVKIIAKEHNIPVWQPLKLSDIATDISSLDNPIGVLVSFGKIIPQSIIDLFTPGIINVHPSMLPKYRGPSPIESAILNGDSETAVTIMQLSAAMDAGPVYGYSPLQLSGTETSAELYEKLGSLGAETLTKLLPLIIDGDATPIEQDDERASYCKLISKEDGVIDWKKPATQIEREVRAYAGWPGSRATIGDIDCIITSLMVASCSQTDNTPGAIAIIDKRLYIGTANGSVEITDIKPVGKKEMPVKAFLAGYKDKLQA